MKDKAVLLEVLIEKVESYIKTTLELYRLKAIDKITDVFATIASSLVIAFIITLFFILVSIGLSLYLGELLGKSYYGFFVLGGFYGVVTIVICLNRRKWLEAKMNDFLINKIFKKKDNVQNK